MARGLPAVAVTGLRPVMAVRVGHSLIRGATFRIRLPLAPADSLAPPVRGGEVICIVNGGGRGRQV